HDRYRHHAPDGRHGSQQVLHIVQPPQPDPGPGQHGGDGAVVGIAEGVVFSAQEGAVVDLVQAGEPDLGALAVPDHGAGDVVFIPQHRTAGRGLPQQDVALGVDVFLHILVVVQVVGGHVGDHRHPGAAAHT